MSSELVTPSYQYRTGAGGRDSSIIAVTFLARGTSGKNSGRQGGGD